MAAKRQAASLLVTLAASCIVGLPASALADEPPNPNTVAPDSASEIGGGRGEASPAEDAAVDSASEAEGDALSGSGQSEIAPPGSVHDESEPTGGPDANDATSDDGNGSTQVTVVRSGGEEAVVMEREQALLADTGDGTATKAMAAALAASLATALTAAAKTRRRAVP